MLPNRTAQRLTRRLLRAQKERLRLILTSNISSATRASTSQDAGTDEMIRKLEIEMISQPLADHLFYGQRILVRFLKFTHFNKKSILF